MLDDLAREGLENLGQPIDYSNDQKPECGIEFTPRVLKQKVDQWLQLAAQDSQALPKEKRSELHELETDIYTELGIGFVDTARKYLALKSKSSLLPEDTTQLATLEKQISSSLTDYEYAVKFWATNGLEGALQGQAYVRMQKDIVKKARTDGQLGVFISSQGITEKEKLKISAYRVMARQMGFGVGKATPILRSGVANMPIATLLPK